MLKIYAFISIVLILYQVVECLKIQTNEKNTNNDKKSVETPRESLDFGLFRMDLFYNQSKSRDKLKISKSFLKREIRHKNSLNDSEPLITIKENHREELVKCDNLTLNQPDQLQLIDCQPLDSYILDQTEYSFSNINDKKLKKESIIRDDGNNNIKKSGLFSKRSTFRQKFKTSAFRINEMYLYPLRKDVVDRNLNSIVADFNLSNLNFNTMNYNLGYYIESSTVDKSNYRMDCSGNVFMSINQTKFFARLINDDFPEFSEEFDFVTQQAIDNGFLLSFQNFNCKLILSEKNSFIDIPGGGINIDFTIIKRQDFPYLSLKHNMKVPSIEELFNYEAKINQIRLPEHENNPFKYNTTISIVSRSALYNSLNFNLNQTFYNLDEFVGNETMSLIHPYFQVVVGANYSRDFFTKRFIIFDLKSEEEDEDKKSITEFISGSISTEDEEFLDVNFKINKKLLPSFFGSYEENSKYMTYKILSSIYDQRKKKFIDDELHVEL